MNTFRSLFGPKTAVFLFLTGVLSLYAAIFYVPHQTNFSKAQVLGEKNNLQLFIEPDDGKKPLLNRVNSSLQVLTEVYLLSDKDIITAVASRSGSILLEEHPFGGGNINQKTKSLLGNKVSWTNPDYTLTHEKAMVFDNQEVCILNMNLTTAAFDKNREYNICSQDPADISEVTAIFMADKNRQSYLPTNPNLVVSPVNSRGKLKALINSAQKSLQIEMEVMTDEQIVQLLSDKSKQITVRIILPRNIVNSTVPEALIKILDSPYPHAKLIIADHARAYVGSVNLTLQSLDQNRELGILVSQPDILGRLTATFEKDWENSTPK